MHHTEANVPPLALSAGVWLATLLAFLACLWYLSAGVVLVMHSLRKDEQHWFNPLLPGVFWILMSGLIAWCQYGAVFRRSAARSFLVGAIFLLIGVLGCIGHWNLVHDLVYGLHLFIGVMMWRWWRRLVVARAARA